MTKGRRKDQFGGVRELPSGRWNARYDVDRRSYQKTFPTRAVAQAWLAWVAGRIQRGEPIEARESFMPDPALGSTVTGERRGQ